MEAGVRWYRFGCFTKGAFLKAPRYCRPGLTHCDRLFPGSSRFKDEYKRGDRTIIAVDAPSGLKTYYLKLDLALGESASAEFACTTHPSHNGPDARFRLDVGEAKEIEKKLVSLYPALFS